MWNWLLSGSLKVKQLTIHEFVSLFHVSDKIGSRQVLSCPLQETTTALVARTFLLLEKPNSSDSRELAPCTSVFFLFANFRRKAHGKKCLPKRKKVLKRMVPSSNSYESWRSIASTPPSFNQGATSTIDLWGWRNQILASHLLHSPLLIYFSCSICQLHLQDFMLFHRPPIMFSCRICHHKIKVWNH